MTYAAPAVFSARVPLSELILNRAQEGLCGSHSGTLAAPDQSYQHFLEYGDAESYRREVETVRKDFRDWQSKAVATLSHVGKVPELGMIGAVTEGLLGLPPLWRVPVDGSIVLKR